MKSNIINNQKYQLNLNLELFDENDKYIDKTNKIITESTYLVRTGNIIKTEIKQSNIQEKEELLFHIRMRKDNFIKIEKPIYKDNLFQTKDSINILEKNLWYAISKNENKYVLCENDIIEFGKMKYIVNEIFLMSDDEDEGNGDDIHNDKGDKNVQANDDYKYLNKNKQPYYVQIPKIENYKKCKFCDDYNICLCNCKDKYIHLPCLKEKLKDKQSENTNVGQSENTNVKQLENKKQTIISYYIKKYNCKVCETTFPIKISVKEKQNPLEIIEIEKPEYSNYIVLESLRNNYKKEDEYDKSIHVIKLTEDVIKIGRNEQNDLVIDDPSIENEHAILKYDEKNKEIILENLTEKDNTFVFIRNGFKMNENKIKIKIGKTLIEANLIKP